MSRDNLKTTVIILCILLLTIGLGVIYWKIPQLSNNDTNYSEKLHLYLTQQKDGQLITLDYKNTYLVLEAAVTDKAHEKGLMYKTELENNKGMIFIYEKPKELTFWMLNTYIPLDIIYLNNELEVVQFYENTKVDQTAELYPSNVPAKYVIEVNSGWAANQGLAIGDKFLLR